MLQLKSKYTNGGGNFMANELNYISVVTILENGKFQINFPDFEGISTIAEKEENIKKTGEDILKIKLKELKAEKIDFPTPTSVVDIQSKLEKNQFINYVSVSTSSKIDLENISSNVSEVSSKIGKKIGDAKTSIENGDVLADEAIINKIGLAGAVIYLIGVFLPMVSAEIPFLGTLRMGFFSMGNLKELSGLVDVGNSVLLARIFGILMLTTAIFAAYSYFKKNDLYIKISSAVAVFLLLLTVIIIKVKIRNLGADASQFVGLSWAWVFLFLGSAVMVAAYVLSFIKKRERKEK